MASAPLPAAWLPQTLQWGRLIPQQAPARAAVGWVGTWAGGGLIAKGTSSSCAVPKRGAGERTRGGGGDFGSCSEAQQQARFTRLRSTHILSTASATAATSQPSPMASQAAPLRVVFTDLDGTIIHYPGEGGLATCRPEDAADPQLIR